MYYFIDSPNASAKNVFDDINNGKNNSKYPTVYLFQALLLFRIVAFPRNIVLLGAMQNTKKKFKSSIRQSVLGRGNYVR